MAQTKSAYLKDPGARNWASYKAGLAEASATPVRFEGDRAHDERAMNECKEAMVALNEIDNAFIADLERAIVCRAGW